MKPHHQRCLAPGCFRAAESGYCAEHEASYHFTPSPKEPAPLSTHQQEVSPITPLQQTMLTAKPKTPLKELIKARKELAKARRATARFNYLRDKA